MQLFVTRRAQALARERDVAHFDPHFVQRRHFGVQLVAVRAGGIGEHRDMSLGLADGWVNHGFSHWNTVDQLGHAQAFGFLGQVDRLAVFQLEQVALDDVLAIGTGVQHTAAFELDLIQPGHRAGTDAFNRRIELQVGQALANSLLGSVIGDNKGGNQRNGCGGNNLGQAHGNS